MKTAPDKSSSSTSTATKNSKKKPFFSKGSEDGFFQRKESDNNNSFFGSKGDMFNSSTPFFNVNNVQTKLKIGQPGDKYEVEADAMADKVVKQIDQPSKAADNLGSNSVSSSPTIVQNQIAEKEEAQEKEVEEREVQPMLQKTSEAAPDEEPDVQTKCEACDKEIQKVEEKSPEEEEPVQLMESEEELQKQEEEEEEQPMLQKTEEKSPEEEEPVQLMESEEELQKQEEEEEAQPMLQKTEEKSPEEEEPVQLMESEEELQKQEEEEEAQPMLQKTEEKSPEEEEPVQLKSASKENTASPDLQSQLNSSKGSGSSLPDGTRSSMESGFGADFSNVKIHTGSEASSMNKGLGAKAFTHGSDIYFNEGEYSPSTKPGQHLLAHELTHTVQQGAVVRQKPKTNFYQTQPKVQGLFGSIWNAAKSVGKSAWNGVKKVGSAVVSAVSKGVDWILGKISPILKRIPGYTLLTVILGKDIITGNPVERDGPNLIKGFIGLIPGGYDLWMKLEESQMISSAFNWLNGEIAKLGLSWSAIKTAFKTAVSSLSVTDVFSPIDAFNTKIKPIFAPILAKILTLGKKVVKKIGEFILEGFLKLAGPFGKKVMDILRKAGTVFWTIIEDPIGFLNNLIGAVKGGINNFRLNIKKHLIGGLISWLTGGMGDLPIQLPQTFDVKGILHLGLQIMGLTWANIRQKLVKRLGEPAVKAAETGVELVKTLITQGPMGLWEMLKDKAGEIKQTIMEGIRNWVVTQLVNQGIIKILSFLNPAGALLQAALAIYNAIMFFVNNWQRISNFVSSVFSSIGKIAAGNIGAAASFIEKAMAQSIPIILSFIARLLNIGSIGKAIKKIIQKIRKPIDKVVNKAIGFIAKQVKKLFKAGKKGLGKVKDAAVGLIQWWKAKRKFKSKDGRSHSLFIKKQGNKKVFYVASKETPVEKFLSTKASIEKDKTKKGKITIAKNYYRNILVAKENDVILKENSYKKEKDKTKKRAKRYEYKKATEDLRSLMQNFAKKLSELDFGDENNITVRSKLSKAPSIGRAHTVTAHPLTYLPGNEVGSSPKEDPPGWKNYAQDASDQWVRGHLLSEHLHGPGKNWNLVPIPQRVNSQMVKVESSTRNKIKKQGAIYHYKTTATYDNSRTDENEKAIPKKLEVEHGEIKRDNNGQFIDGKFVTVPFDNIGLPNMSGKPDLNSVGTRTIQNKGIGGQMALDIIKCRDSFVETNNEFTNYNDLVEMMGKYYKDKAAIIEQLGRTIKPKGLKNKRDIPLDQLSISLDLTPKNGISNPYNLSTDRTLEIGGFVRNFTPAARKKLRMILVGNDDTPAIMDIKPLS